MSATHEIGRIESKSTATVVLDVQPVIMSMIEGSKECLDPIVKTIDAGQKRGCLTVYIRVAFTHQEWANIPPSVKNFHEMKMQMGNEDKAPDSIHIDSDTTALHPQIRERVDKGPSIVIRKTRFGPFAGTHLLEELQQRGIKTLIVVGFKTSGAVLSTVRFAADHDFKVWVVQDAVKDPDSHLDEILLGKVLPEQAHVITAAELDLAFDSD